MVVGAFNGPIACEIRTHLSIPMVGYSVSAGFPSPADDYLERPPAGEVSRREFLRGTAAGALTGGLLTGALLGETEAAPAETGVLGPGKVPLTLVLNGTRKKLELEPRVTLLDAIRNRADLTGNKITNRRHVEPSSHDERSHV